MMFCIHVCFTSIDFVENNYLFQCESFGSCVIAGNVALLSPSGDQVRTMLA